MARCTATTDAGARCRLPAVEDGLCHIHRPAPLPTVIEAMDGPFRRAFGNLESWARWAVVLKALYGLPLEESEVAVFRELTGRLSPREGGYDEAWLICGRRAGKSRIAALLAAYEATFGTAKDAPNIFIVAETRAQAKIILSFCADFLRALGRHAIAGQNRDEIVTSSGVTISIQTASERSIRGWSVRLAILDEAWFFSTPVEPIVTAIRPSLVGKLIGLSSRGPDVGYLAEIRARYWSNEVAPVLVVQAPTLAMNPTFSAKKIEHECAANSLAVKEYDPLAPVEDALFKASAIDAASGPESSGPVDGARYIAAVDSSAGASDSFTLSIVHSWNEKLVVDLVREAAPPFDPLTVLDDFAAEMKRFGVKECYADRYAYSWVESALRKEGIAAQRARGVTTTDLYFILKGRLDAGEVELVRNDRLRSQLLSLEIRRTDRGGEYVEPPRGSHDDVANVVALALWAWLHTNVPYWKPIPAEKLPVKLRKRHPNPEEDRRRRILADLDEVKAEAEEDMIAAIERDFGPVAIPLKRTEDGSIVAFAPERSKF
jgi:hypothetical protein